MEAANETIDGDIQKGDKPFAKLKTFSRQCFSWVMNWDIHYFLPLATTWFSPSIANWVTRFYMKCPF